MKSPKIKYKFKDKGLLTASLTHPSRKNEKGGDVDNQRLEFLGDSVVGCVASEVLWEIFPDASEGDMSIKKSSVVSGRNLAGYARKINLGGCLLLGKGEEKEDGRDRDSNLADAFEALAGAVFLDGGYKAARDFLSELILGNKEQWSELSDYKSELQKVFHKKTGSLPVYKTEETGGGARGKYFFSEVGDGEEILGRGQGENKKEAEQRAAREALENIS
ncbi:MAG: ribonuclease III [Thermodesulfobacteriota bacterium]